MRSVDILMESQLETKQAYESEWLACRMPMRHSSPAATHLYFPYEA